MEIVTKSIVQFKALNKSEYYKESTFKNECRSRKEIENMLEINFSILFFCIATILTVKNSIISI